MKTQQQMFSFLQRTLLSHDVELVGNKIKAKKLLKSRSFSSFKLTYLKNGQEVSLNAGKYTKRYTSDDELLNLIHSFGFYKENKTLWEEINYEMQS
ncbi:hypothetical protein [Ferdinandcohnia sp. SAFN-114]|uniref:hypothetical protein n=1 Tax=Ferdinandcohnia sp. SAFN-114 TaxID=3387275 RepID=UPI003F7E028E